MDIENLIEQLNRYFEGETLPRGTALDAATAITDLLARAAAAEARVKKLTEAMEREQRRAEKAERKLNSLLDEEETVAFDPFGVQKEE